MVTKTSLDRVGLDLPRRPTRHADQSPSAPLRFREAFVARAVLAVLVREPCAGCEGGGSLAAVLLRDVRPCSSAQIMHAVSKTLPPGCLTASSRLGKRVRQAQADRTRRRRRLRLRLRVPLVRTLSRHALARGPPEGRDTRGSVSAKPAVRRRPSGQSLTRRRSSAATLQGTWSSEDSRGMPASFFFARGIFFGSGSLGRRSGGRGGTGREAIKRSKLRRPSVLQRTDPEQAKREERRRTRQ